MKLVTISSLEMTKYLVRKGKYDAQIQVRNAVSNKKLN